MKPSFCVWMLFSGFVMAMPTTTQAQMFRRPFSGCCETCQMPHANCQCSITQPVVQTQLRPQQVTTYRDVTETHVRNETVVQNVPVTSYRTVTVDEDGYQMVWVPKPVTKQVAQTVIQQQTQTRAVPYQVTRRVPQVMTQLVPVQTVQHVSETIPLPPQTVVFSAPTPMMAPMASRPCKSCGRKQAAYAPTPMPAPQIGYTYAQAPLVSNPNLVPAVPFSAPAAPLMTMPPIAVPVPQSVQVPIPADSADDQWQTIRPRSSAAASAPANGPALSRAVPMPSDEARATPSRPSRFVPAPTAARVWATRP
jgi:hypothetical protein